MRPKSVPPLAVNRTKPMSEDTKVLVQKFIEGDGEAYAELVRRYKKENLFACIQNDGQPHRRRRGNSGDVRKSV